MYCVSGRGICCIVIYVGNEKPIVFDQVLVLQCCRLFIGDKRGGTWIVRLWEGTWIVGLLRYERLDSRAYGKESG